MSYVLAAVAAAGAIAPVLLTTELGGSQNAMVPEPSLAFVGTYTGGGSEGIYTLRMDPQTGALQQVGVTSGIENPSFLALHPSMGYLYAVQETQDSHAVVAFAVNRETGALAEIGRQSSGGAHPCHLTIDPTGSLVIVANYSGGSIAVLPVLEDGSIAPASQIVRHQGRGPDLTRQEGPHAHSVTIDPTGTRVLAADLGIDRIMVYRIDRERGVLVPSDPPFVAVAPGAGPRHLAFHPSGRYSFVANELNSTVTAFLYDTETGAMAHLQTISTLPDSWDGSSTCADIHVHPSGRFLYASNRGHDSIVCYSVDPVSGCLTLIGIEPAGGKTPRNFAIEPGGRYLYVANQDTGNIVQFSIDPESGELSPTGHEIQIPAPVCLVFAPS